MRLVPASVGKLNALNWGQALTALGYQRVQLRIFFASLLLSLPVLPLIVAYTLYKRMGENASEIWAMCLMGAAAVIGVLMLLTILWLCWTMVKVSIMRWRGLGFKAVGAVVLLAASLLMSALIGGASEIGQSPELLLTGMVPLWVYKWLALAVVLQILQALFTYWSYLEETPLSPVTATVQEPYSTAPGRFEATLLFLQQVWIWFSILSVPMYFIVSIL